MLIQIDDKTVIDFDEIAAISEEVDDNELYTHTIITLRSGVQITSNTPILGIKEVIRDAWVKGVDISTKHINTKEGDNK